MLWGQNKSRRRLQFWHFSISKKAQLPAMRITEQPTLLTTTNNQRLEKCVPCILLLYNWDLRVFSWPTPHYSHGHNLVLLKFTRKQVEIA